MNSTGRQSAAITVQADVEAAKAGLDEVQAAVDALPDKKVIEIAWTSSGEGPRAPSGAQDMPGYASGGWTGPGRKHQVAGLVHADEFVTRKEVVRQPGALHFLDNFNRVGMRALEVFRNGYSAGGFVQPGEPFEIEGLAVGLIRNTMLM